MLPKARSDRSMLCYYAWIVFVIHVLFSHGFVLLSSAAPGLMRSGSEGKGYEGPHPAEPAHVYSLLTELQVAEISNDVTSKLDGAGYQLHSTLHVAALWESTSGEKLLRFELIKPKVFIKSRKAPTPEGFVEHTSPLDTMTNEPFYAIWNQGSIDKIYLSEKETLSLINYKKGIISLFQFQILDMDVNETDVSHHCSVHYSSLSPTTFRKIKTNCTMPIDTFTNTHPEKIFSVVTNSKRQTDYHMSNDNSVLKSIMSEELHTFNMEMKKDAGSEVKLVQKMELIENEKGNKFNLKGFSINDAIQELVKEGAVLKEHQLSAAKEPTICQDDCPTLAKLIKSNKDVLKSSRLGSVKSAIVFIKLLRAARQSTANEILKALNGVKNKETLQQLCDLIGLTQTLPAHQAAKKFLHFDSEYDIDNTERYLWALGTGSHPLEEIIYDLLKISEKKNIPKKIFETLTLTIGAMAHNYAQKSQFGYNNKVVSQVKNHITHYLSKCSDNECKIMYLRALKNLKHPETINIIVNYAVNGQKPVSVAAMKALKSVPKLYWDENVIKECQKIFYELNKRYDSSSRTLAADIILDSQPSEEVLKELVWFLTTNERVYEVKQFLYQRLLMISDKCLNFKNTLINIIKDSKASNNWHVLSQKGLSTAFMRPFMNTEWMNGSLISIQEISGGVLKRGHIDVIVESNGEQKELFSLGLFAGGLSSFMSSGSNGDEEETTEEETATAGMELTVQGKQIRPFVFFNGQSELMGHVWSGTASDRTTAFQVLTLLHDHIEWLTLGNGVTLEMSLIGAVSFDLAGQVELSIWSRTAHSIVEKSAGIAIQGLIKADNSFIRSQAEFVVATEPKLNLVSDLDFYNDIALCMQLKQPDTTVKHNIYKVERIPGSKHKLRKTIYKTTRVPGKTYALNRKNNMMCNVIHNK